MRRLRVAAVLMAGASLIIAIGAQVGQPVLARLGAPGAIVVGAAACIVAGITFARENRKTAWLLALTVASLLVVLLLVSPISSLYFGCAYRQECP